MPSHSWQLSEWLLCSVPPRLLGLGSTAQHLEQLLRDQARPIELEQRERQVAKPDGVQREPLAILEPGLAQQVEDVG